MEQTSRTGLPLIRPLFLAYPGEEDFAQQDREFFLGDDLLIAPALSETLDAYPVRLPPGDWFDYWSGKRLAGATTIQVQPALDRLPVFVRAGAILPMQPVVQSTSERPRGALELWVYPGAGCRGSVYADDGQTLDYTRGDFSRTEFACDANADEIRIALAASVGPFQPWWNTIAVHVVGLASEPASVTLSNEPTSKWSYDSSTQQLVIEVPRGPSTIAIHLGKR
jgi:alpha-glucosidase